MKKTTLIIVMMLAQVSFAQFNELAPWNNNLSLNRSSNSLTVLDNSFNNYFASHDMYAKSSGMKPYMRWRYVWEDYFTPNGFKPISVIDRAFAQKQRMAASIQDDSQWTSVGPSIVNRNGSSADKGRVNAVLVDSNNNDIMYVGAPAGGIWKTTNGGVDWTPLTDHLPQIGVSAIALSPADHNTIYIGTGDDDARVTYSRGVYKSTDGGANWVGIGPNFNSESEVITEIIIHPTNPDIILVASSDGIYKTTDGGVNWQKKLQINAKEMRMHPTNPDIIYTVSGDSFYKSTDGGNNFIQIILSNMANFGRLVLDVTPAAPNKVYVATAKPDGKFNGLYVSGNSGDSFSKTAENSNIFGNRNQTWYDFAIAVSDTDPSKIFIGNVDIYESTNGGASFSQYNQWDVNNPQYTHADIHFLRFFDGKLTAGSDGGVYISNDDESAFRGLNKNLVIGQFYRISVSKEQNYQVYGGLQDNGGYARNNMRWYVWHGGDGMDNVISNRDSQKGYSFLYFGQALFVTNNGGTSINNTVPSPNGERGNWVTPLAIDAFDNVFAGFSKLYKLGGNGWVAVTNNAFGNNIQTITCDLQDNNHILVGVGRKLYRSTDAGVTFTEILSAPSTINSIAVNSVEHKIWCTANSQVWQSSDDGTNWIDITGNLPGEKKNVIRYQMFSPHNSIYVGSDIGVYYRDDTTGGWQVFSEDLPNVPVYDLEINNDQGLLVAGTYGRGVWETAIPVYYPTKDAKMKKIESSSGHLLECNGQPTIKFVIENKGTETIHQLEITYIIDGVSQTENWNGNLDQNNTIEVTPANQNWTQGSHFIEAKVVLNGDQLLSNNIITKNIIINQTKDLPYTNGFEDANNDAIINFSSNNNSSWEIAKPNGSNLTQTGGGAKAYCTNASGKYNNDTKDYLLTPCYDMTQLTNPEISFKMAHDIEKDYDAFYVQYSIDNGVSWQLLGEYGDRRWYNSDSSEGACVGGQWTGTNLSMNTYKHDLDFIANEPNVVFRFVMAADPLSAQDGVVFDQLRIANKGGGSGNAKVSIFPNPTENELNISWSDINAQNVSIFNLQGMLIYQHETAGLNALKIDLSNVAKGVYLVLVNTQKETFANKIIVK